MTLTNLGELSIGAIIPGAMGSYAAVLAQLQAQLEGAIALAAQLSIRPPSLQGNLDAALALVAALQASIALGLPGVDFQVAAVAQLIASLEAKVALLLGVPFGTGGIYAYAYTGDTAGMGSAITGAVGSATGDQCYALILLARASASIAALKQVFIH